jgi:hypothetical protein
MTHNLQAQLPNDNELQRGLSSINIATGREHDWSQIRLISREFSESSSSYPSEIVNCQTDEGRHLRLFCKYSITDHTDGHRKGIIHESNVYGEVLQSYDSTTPAYFGIFKAPKAECRCLVLEHVTDAIGISRAHNGMRNAARWLGQFHKEGLGLKKVPMLLEKYDKEFYLQWSRRVASFASQSGEFNWMNYLIDWYEENIANLLSTEQTVIHGEFYPSNVLAKGEIIYPVDWESAAVAAGELDLAALIEGWQPSITKLCIAEYLRSRWPRGAPPDIRRNITVARIYWHLRWLGENPSWTKGKKRRWRVAELRRNGEQLGLI